MTLKWNVNKSFWIGILLIFLMLFVFICSARAEVEAIPGGMCYYTFDEEQAKRIVVIYDQLQQCRGLATSEGYLVDEFDNKILMLEESQKMLNVAIANCEMANRNLKQIVEFSKEEQELRMKKCLEDIEAAKPKLRDKATWFGTGGLFGLLIGALLL